MELSKGRRKARGVLFIYLGSPRGCGIVQFTEVSKERCWLFVVYRVNGRSTSKANVPLGLEPDSDKSATVKNLRGRRIWRDVLR